MTDAERHQRAKALFLEIVALPAGERAAALARKCAADDAMREEIESLLAHAGSVTGVDQQQPAVILGPPRRFETGDLFADRYRIVAGVGRGATGEVYRAVDTRLGVEIALKILHRSSPSAIRHLIEEVRLARQLSDPAICRIYDVEEADGDFFLTMEFVDGEDLASLLARVGRLSSEKVRTIGIELCRALTAAHEHGVLHRDLKPSNVMLDGAGAVRLTDFGVAALESAADSAPFAGTPAYMAPEQLHDGAPASVKTDLYAVGLVLYEALVGHAPGSDTAEPAPVSALVRISPPSALVGDVDPALESIVMSMLERSPDARPPSAAEVAARLAALAPSERARVPTSTRSASRRRLPIALAAVACVVVGVIAYFAADGVISARHPAPTIAEEIVKAAGATSDASEAGIAVLPIADESDSQDQRPVAEAIQDAIIERLSSMRGLRVIAEDSSDRFGQDADVKVVARELDIDLVAVGSIRGGNDTARVDVALYDGRSGERLWTQNHVYGIAPAKALEIDHAIADALASRLRLSASVAAAPAPSVSEPDTATYSLYLRGREHVPPFSRTEFESSVDLLKQVIERTPAFAPAYAAIATAYVTACAVRWIEPRDGYPTARRYADRAVVLDPTLAEAHVALALIAGEYDWDWRAAEASYARALELAPGSAWAHRSFGRFLATQGRFEESLAATRRAVELDPTSALMAQGAAQRFYDARLYDRAVAMARIAVRLDPINPYSYPTLASALLEQGEYDEAIAQLEKAMVISGINATGKARIAYAFARAGNAAAAATAAAETRQIGTPDSLERALLAMAEHDETAAVAALADAVEARAPPSIWLAVAPPLDPLRDREDFRALIAKVGLPNVDLTALPTTR